MKWFYSLKKAARVIIAVCAWLPLCIFAGVISGSIGNNGENMQTWQAVVVLLLLALGIFFTVLAVIASKRERTGAKQATQTGVTPPQPSVGKTAPPSTQEPTEAREVWFSGTPSHVVKLIKNGNADMQDNIECCNVGDDIYLDYDYDKCLYVCAHDVGDIGYIPEKVGDQLTGRFCVKISNITENDEGKFSVEVSIYPQLSDNDVVNLPVHTKVVGVSFGDRQERIKQSKVGDTLIIKHTPTQDFPTAAEVINARTGQSLGHIQKQLAAALLSSFGNGFILDGVISDITGGTPDAPHYGCNIKIRAVK
jgi:hypothetical protein